MLRKGSPRRSLGCAVCRDLIPKHHISHWWSFHVAENLLIECVLSLAFSDLEVASQSCALCTVIKAGIETMIPGVNNVSVEVKVLGEDGNEEKNLRLQYFREGGNHDPKLSVFGIARNIAPFVSPRAHSPLIQEWVEHCIQSHNACKQRPQSSLPARLLDISPRPDASVRLVTTQQLPISSEVPLYATLSHCWGTKKFIRTTLSNFDSHSAHISFDSFPRTFQDAISVIRELGICYIWIDALCIIQDSPEDWKRESALMASIYSNSYLNIAATGSPDSSHAFLSSRNQMHQSFPIRVDSRLERFQGQESGVFVRASLNQVHKLYSTPSQNANWRSVENGNTETPLLSRAWVFQERYLAPRTLHFHPSELVMECRSGLRCECSGLDSFTTNPVRYLDVSFDTWFSIIEDYSRLNLTYQSDRLTALTGVAKTFWEKLGCRYLDGIWEGGIAKGLLWDVTRYESLNPSTGKVRRQGKEVAPTWSWASLVLFCGNRIFFPFGNDPSFRADDRFEFLDTDPAQESPQSCFQSRSGKILVKSAFMDGITCFGSRKSEAEQNVLLISLEDLDDIVLVGTSVLVTDVPLEIEELAADTFWDTPSLLIGSSKEEDLETNQTVIYNHMLVLHPSSHIQGAWERLGILNSKEGIRGSPRLAETVFKLV